MKSENPTHPTSEDAKATEDVKLAKLAKQLVKQLAKQQKEDKDAQATEDAKLAKLAKQLVKQLAKQQKVCPSESEQLKRDNPTHPTSKDSKATEDASLAKLAKQLVKQLAKQQTVDNVRHMLATVFGWPVSADESHNANEVLSSQNLDKKDEVFHSVLDAFFKMFQKMAQELERENVGLVLLARQLLKLIKKQSLSDTNNDILKKTVSDLLRNKKVYSALVKHAKGDPLFVDFGSCLSYAKKQKEGKQEIENIDRLRADPMYAVLVPKDQVLDVNQNSDVNVLCLALSIVFGYWLFDDERGLFVASTFMHGEHSKEERELDKKLRDRREKRALETPKGNTTPDTLSRGGYGSLEENHDKTNGKMTTDAAREIALRIASFFSEEQAAEGSFVPEGRGSSMSLEFFERLTQKIAQEVNMVTAEDFERLKKQVRHPVWSSQLILELLKTAPSLFCLPLRVTLDKSAFVVENDTPFDIHHKEVLEFIQGGVEPSMSIVQLWVMFLNSLSVGMGNEEKFGFFEPQTIRNLGKREEATAFIQKQMQKSKKLIYLGACQQEENWQLFVLMPKHRLVFWICSQQRKPSVIIKDTIEGLVTQYLLDDHSELTKVTVSWIYPEGDFQDKGWGSGFYVMHSMWSIVRGHTNLLHEDNNFSRVSLEEIRTQWVRYFFDVKNWLLVDY